MPFLKNLLGRKMYFPLTDSGRKLGFPSFNHSYALMAVGRIIDRGPDCTYHPDRDGYVYVGESTLGEVLIPTAISRRWNNLMCYLAQ